MIEATKPASRVLALLELLQDRPGISGPVLAEELGVTTRTIRRYVITLQEMGIPVEPMAGRTGGYWLRPGFRLPPLMFSPEEAIGLTIALLASRTTASTDLPRPVTQALTKIERVLPRDLAERIESIRSSMLLPERNYPAESSFPNPNVLATLAQATLSSKRCWMRYGRPDGDESAREVDCYGIVVHHGRWYLHGYCHLRKGTRTFRIDRIRRVDLLETCFERPADIDVRAAVMASIALVRSDYQVELEIRGPIAMVRDYVYPDLAVLEEIDATTTRLISSTETLDWFVRRMGMVPFSIRVISPPEMVDAFHEHAQRLLNISLAVGVREPVAV
ncbi:MAG TPA: YafY family protein [Thermomicrobiales bacterium]|nr:YafY family protein [Thermomicrobiales bacterium]